MFYLLVLAVTIAGIVFWARPVITKVIDQRYQRKLIKLENEKERFRVRIEELELSLTKQLVDGE